MCVSQMITTPIWFCCFSTGGWGAIEYGSKAAGQVEGGRWKPFMYLLAASAYSDQLAHCALDGVCFAKNDNGVQSFEGRVVVSVTALASGKQMVLSNRTVGLPLGPGSTQWFCATDNTSNRWYLTEKSGENYTRFFGEIPSDRKNFSGPIVSPLVGCEVACDKQATCVGFTRGNSATVSAKAECFFYTSVSSLSNAAPSASFFLKPGQPVPARPAPPLPPPADPMPDCVPFASQMERLGCSASGSNCVLSCLVLNQAGVIVSNNVNTLVPPKLVTGLKRAEIAFEIGDSNPLTGVVPITVRSSVTALWVVLSTLVEGRFSDGAFMLHANQSRSIDFLPWGDLSGEVVVAELKKSLRVESLSSYLPIAGPTFDEYGRTASSRWAEGKL